MHVAFLEFSHIQVTMFLGRPKKKGQAFVLHLANEVAVLV